MKNKKRKKLNKHIAFFIVFILTIIGICLVVFKTDTFYIEEVKVDNNYKLNDEYIVEKTELSKNDNIFLINLENIKTKLKKEVYIKDVEINRKLPDIIEIIVTERTGRINYSYNDKNILIDFDGIVLENIKKQEGLILIESDVEINENPGEEILFDDSTVNAEKLLGLSKYIYENNKLLNCHILMKNNNLYCIIENNTYIKLDFKESLEYQYEFGLDIIEKRKTNGENIEGVIDFTKGENPIYVDFKDLEESI